MGYFFKTIFRLIRNIILIFLLLGICTTAIDYLRMRSGDVPVFNISHYQSKTHIQVYQGPFYVAQRKVKNSVDESLSDSTELQFLILNRFALEVPEQYSGDSFDFTLDTVETVQCDGVSTLYYQAEDFKVYTYCLDEISVREGESSQSLLSYLEKDVSIVDDIDSHLGYVGFYQDQTTLMFYSYDDSFTTHGLSMFRCNGLTQDVYIGPKSMVFQPDFCIVK